MPNDGIVYLVGAGPGDPGLLTVRARELIEQADAIVYDKLIPDGVLDYARSDCEMHDVGKQAGKHTMPQEEMNTLLCKLASEGKMVVRLKGGDPFIFGRGGEEALALREAGLRFSVVCGVTSGSAVPIYAGIPATHRGIATSLHFITGHEDPTKDDMQVDFDALARVGGTLVFYMGVSNLPKIATELMAHGKSGDTHCAVIHQGCSPKQRTVTGKLSEIAAIAIESGIKPPSIIIIGDVCKFRDELNWFENTPLFGKSVVVTRTRTQASKLTSALRLQGAQVIELPTIDIRAAELSTEDRDRLRSLDEYDWVVFTSQNVILPFFDFLSEEGLDARALAGVKIAAIGGATADSLRCRGLTPDLVPETFTSAGLLEAFQNLSDEARGTKYLLPRADIASRELPEGLADIGVECVEVDIYRTTPAAADPESLSRILSEGIDYITFASSSSVENFERMIGKEAFEELSRKSCFISIGPATSGTISKLGGRIGCEADVNDINGLLAAIIKKAGIDNE